MNQVNKRTTRGVFRSAENKTKTSHEHRTGKKHRTPRSTTLYWAFIILIRVLSFLSAVQKHSVIKLTLTFDPFDLFCVFAADGALFTSRAIWRASPASAEPPQVIGIIRRFSAPLIYSSAIYHHHAVHAVALQRAWCFLRQVFFPLPFWALSCDGKLLE